jgi:hypothetical protein
MNTSSLCGRSCQKSRHFHPWQQTALLCALLFMVAGCANCQKQIKTYISGQEQDVAFPLRQVMLASAKGLTDLNIAISRMEFVGPGGLIQAHGPDREATLRFKPMDQRNTRVHIDVFTGERARDIAFEEALSSHINDMLAHRDLPLLNEFTARMIPVHQTPRPDSRIIAYLAGGTFVSASWDQEGWSNVTLLSGGVGYILSKNLTAASNETVVNIRRNALV